MKILYLSTNNMCRSILAESITRKYGEGKAKAMSGGSHPGDDIHTVAHRVLKDHRYSATNLVSKSWDQFAGWAPDIVITLCGGLLKQKCPTYVGSSVHVHWGLPDPTREAGSLEDNITKIFHILDQRIKKMLDADLANMDRDTLRAHLKGVIE